MAVNQVAGTMVKKKVNGGGRRGVNVFFSLSGERKRWE